MTEDDLKEFLESNKADIQSAVKAKVIEGLLAQHRWEISGQIAEVVKEFTATEIIPEVKKYLADQKGPILEAACSGAAEIGDQIAKSMATFAAKNIGGDTYKFRNVMKALFD